jgi:glyoxylase-like metal-dependent hydrolase (beta-lactamase superfamily II)
MLERHDLTNWRMAMGSFPGGWGRVDLPGGSPEAMAASLARLATLDDRLRVLPGHGAATTIGRERRLLDLVRREGRLPA